MSELQELKVLQGKIPELKQYTEAYKFTPLSSFLDEYFKTDSSSISAVSWELDEGNFINLVIEDGEVKDFPEVHGLSFRPLHECREELSGDHPFGQIELSMIKGVVIEIAPRTKLPRPMRIIKTHSSSLGSSGVIIHLKEGAEASVLEEAYSSGLGLFQTVLKLGQGAHLELVQVMDNSSGTLTHSQVLGEVKKDAHLRHVLLHLGGRLTRTNAIINLEEPGAHAESYDLYLTHKNEHSDMSTQIHHRAPDTTSDQIAKGILGGESKGIFTGRIHIHPKAQRVAAGQLNKNLLLTKKAQAHSQPQLEIFADDVKCSHGSTTGELSQEEIFYFESRGIPQNKARTLLCHGFGREVAVKIKNSSTRSVVEKRVMECLLKKFQSQG
jgi:Fe-S cluster assembly protein SufD